MAKSFLPATTLPNIGNAQITLESDVLVAVFLVVGAVLYFRGIPQALYRAVMTNPATDPGMTDYTGGHGFTGPYQNQVDPKTFPPGSAGAPGGGSPPGFIGPPTPASALSPGLAPSTSPGYNSFNGVIVPPSFNPVNQQAGGSIDPQPGGIIGAAPFIPPFFTSCWSLPDGSTIGQCRG